MKKWIDMYIMHPTDLNVLPAPSVSINQTSWVLLILLDFPIREVHCDAPAETEWEKLAQNLQL